MSVVAPPGGCHTSPSRMPAQASTKATVTAVTRCPSGWDRSGGVRVRPVSAKAVYPAAALTRCPSTVLRGLAVEADVAVRARKMVGPSEGKTNGCAVSHATPAGTAMQAPAWAAVTAAWPVRCHRDPLHAGPGAMAVIATAGTWGRIPWLSPRCAVVGGCVAAA